MGCVLAQAFDRNGNGTLDVSDLTDLLKNLQGFGSSPVTTEGVEAAMRQMDENCSGQVILFCYPRP